MNVSEDPSEVGRDLNLGNVYRIFFSKVFWISEEGLGNIFDPANRERTFFKILLSQIYY